jgi:hypothetical protein
MPGVTPGYAPGWDQLMYQQGASSSAWVSASSGEWVIPAGAAYGDATSSSSGLRLSSRGATLTQQMSELNIRVSDMEETVHQHVESTRDWYGCPARDFTQSSWHSSSSWRSRGPTTGGWDSPSTVVNLKLSWGRTPTLR